MNSNMNARNIFTSYEVLLKLLIDTFHDSNKNERFQKITKHIQLSSFDLYMVNVFMEHSGY